MRLTTMTDYAMRLLMYVAQHPERLCTIAEVAQAYDISEAHLMKITHQLAQSGWLATVRGKGGGMRLAAAPNALTSAISGFFPRLAAAPGDINLGAVVRSIEPDFFLVDCLGNGSVCKLNGRCRLTGIVSGALQSFMQYLDDYTLADLLPMVTEDVAKVRPVALHKQRSPLQH